MSIESISRNVVAGDYEEAMRLALVDWNEQWGRGQHGHDRRLFSITITELHTAGWRLVQHKLRTDFGVVFEFDPD